MSEAAVSVLVTLLDRVRERSRSTWPALVDAHHDDEALGHEAFAALADAEGEAAFYDDDVIESSPRIKVLDPEPESAVAEDAAEARAEARVDEGDAPVLELLGERPLGDVAEAEVADAMPLLEHVTLGELVSASLALRPRPDAW